MEQPTRFMLTALTAYDGPQIGLAPTDTTASWSFQAQSYLMWTASGVSGAIPVPLGYVFWSFQTKSSQNLSTHVWANPTIVGKIGQFVPGLYYPQWSIVDINKDPNTTSCSTTSK